MMEDVQGRVDVLSKVKKLPAKMNRKKFEEAKAGFASAKDEWNKAQESFKNGNFADAISVATSVKDKVVKVMESLGMSVPVAETPAPAPAPAAAPGAAKQ
jgi:lysyl-tRNA synthetase class I